MKNVVEISQINLEISRLKKFSLKDLFRSESPITLFKNLNMTMDDENYLLLGDNGIGKSTLLRLMSGVLTPDSGEIKVSKNPLYCISQNIIFFTRVSIFENLKFASRIFCQKDLDFEEAQRIMAFSELNLDLNYVSNGLSTGMSSRLMISLALLSGKNLIFFDETFANVQNDFTDKAIEYAKNNSIQLVITTHSPNEFNRFNFKKIYLADCCD